MGHNEIKLILVQACLSALGSYGIVAALCAAPCAASGPVRDTVQLGKIDVADIDSRTGMTVVDPNAHALRYLILKTAVGRVVLTPDGDNKLSVLIARTIKRRVVEYVARVLVVDSRTGSMRHAVNAIARARRGRSGQRNLHLEHKVAAAATARAIDDAFALVAASR